MLSGNNAYQGLLSASLSGSTGQGLTSVGGGSIELQALLLQVDTLQSAVTSLTTTVQQLQLSASAPLQLSNPLNDSIWKINNDGSIEGDITSNAQTTQFVFEKDPSSQRGYLVNQGGLIIGDGDSYLGTNSDGSAVMGNITQDTTLSLLSTAKTARLTLGGYGPMLQVSESGVGGNLEVTALPQFSLTNGSAVGIDTTPGNNQLNLSLGSNAALVVKPALTSLQGVALRNIVQGLQLDSGDASLTLPGLANASKGVKFDYTSSASVSSLDRQLLLDGTVDANLLSSNAGLLLRVKDALLNQSEYSLDVYRLQLPDQTRLEFATDGLYSVVPSNLGHTFLISDTPYLSVQTSLLQGYNQIKAQGFAQSHLSTIGGDELVTWGTLSALIDVLVPIGSLQISANGAPPNSFQGKITWTLYAALDNKYMKFTTAGAVVGTAQAQSLLSHTHSPGTLQTLATVTASGTTQVASTGTGVTGTGVTGTGVTGTGVTGTGTIAAHSTNTGTTQPGLTVAADTGDNIPHPLVITEGVAAGGNNANSAAVGNTTALGAPGVPSLSIGAHKHNVPALTVPALTVNALTVNSQPVPALTVPALTVPALTVPALTVPALTVPSLTVNGLAVGATSLQGATAATGDATNEVSAVYMLIYQRTA